MPTERPHPLVVLRGGTSVPAPAYVLLVELQMRPGVTVHRDGSTILVDGDQFLTDAERNGIRRWKPFLLTLLRYCEQADLDAHLFTDSRPSAAREAQP